MNTKSTFALSVILLATALGSLGCGREGNPTDLGVLAPGAGSLEGGLAPQGHPVDIPFDPTGFVPQVTNQYFPLTPGTVLSYVEHTPDGVEANDVEVLAVTKDILGVQTTVVHDVVKLDGSLEEDTFDWYAQDKAGNVWYFGEDTKQYDHGVLVDSVGSWEAGKNNAQAGIIMLADPQKGDTYQQENSPGVVADMARVVSLDETVTVPFGTFTHCLKTTDWTPLEPGVRESKFYAPGVGVVLEESSRGGHQRVELTNKQP